MGCIKILLESLNRIIHQTSSSVLEPPSYLDFNRDPQSISLNINDKGNISDKSSSDSTPGSSYEIRNHQDFCFEEH